MGAASVSLADGDVAMYNGGPRHTGVYETEPLRTLEGVKWRVETVGAVTSPPLVLDGVVYFGDWEGHFYAVDIDSGTEVWRRSGLGAAAGPPTILDGVAYWGCREGENLRLPRPSSHQD